MHIILDVWDGSYRAFQAFARSPSRYGGFDAPNLAHMMAEQAVKDTVWYRAARADPEAHLPRLYRFIREGAALPGVCRRAGFRRKGSLQGDGGLLPRARRGCPSQMERHHMDTSSPSPRHALPRGAPSDVRIRAAQAAGAWRRA